MYAEISAQTILLNYFVSRPIGESVEVKKLLDLAHEVSASTKHAVLDRINIDEFYHYAQQDSVYFDTNIKEYTPQGFTIRKIGDALMPINTCIHNRSVKPSYIIPHLEKVWKKHNLPLAHEVYKKQKEQEEKEKKEFQTAQAEPFIKHPDFIIEKKGPLFIAKTNKGKIFAEGFKYFELMTDKLLVVNADFQTLFDINGKPLPNAEKVKHVTIHRENPQVYTVVTNSWREKFGIFIQQQNQR